MSTLYGKAECEWSIQHAFDQATKQLESALAKIADSTASIERNAAQFSAKVEALMLVEADA